MKTKDIIEGQEYAIAAFTRSNVSLGYREARRAVVIEKREGKRNIRVVQMPDSRVRDLAPADIYAPWSEYEAARATAKEQQKARERDRLLYNLDRLHVNEMQFDELKRLVEHLGVEVSVTYSGVYLIARDGLRVGSLINQLTQGDVK